MQQRFDLLDIANGSLKDAKGDMNIIIVDEQDTDKHFQCMLCLVALCCYFFFCSEWTTEGCVRVEVNESVVTCNCSHLTNFAILVVRISRMYVHGYADYSMLS